MHSLFVRRKRVFAAAAVLFVLAACGKDEPGSAKLKNLKEGMTIEEAVSAMGKGPLTATYSDTMRLVGGYRRQRFLIDGKMVEVVYARDTAGDVTEPVLQARETPIVFVDNKMMGSGWRFFVDEGMPKYRIPTPLRVVDTLTAPKKDSLPKGPGGQEEKKQ